MALNSRQKTAIVAIVVIGALATGGVLLTRPEAAHDSHEAHGAHGHQGADHDGHGDHDHGPGDKDNAKDAGHGGDAHASEIVRLEEAQWRSAGVTVQAAGPAHIATTLQFPGEIRFNEDRTAHVVPRVAGVAESVPATLGQAVRKGEVLAVIASPELAEQRSALLAARQRLALARTTFQREEALWKERISAEQDYLQARNAMQEAEIAVRNASQRLAAIGAGASDGALNRFALRAPFDGVVVEKHLALGEAVKEDASVFTIADLRTVWAEFSITPKDLSSVRVGAAVTITSAGLSEVAHGNVSYVGAFLGEQTRSARARVTLTNPGAAWRPGLFVTVALQSGAAEVPVAVAADAIQRLGDGSNTGSDTPSVFVAVPGGFRAQPVQLGRSDGKVVEIVSGLAAGTPYAATHAFVLKAEQGKAGAEHAH